jgi:hypothetical protein
VPDEVIVASKPCMAITALVLFTMQQVHRQ